MHISIDCRYLRERPSGIGAYVQALVDRMPAAAPHDRFHLWAHPLAARPLSTAPNVAETRVGAEANGPQTLAWPSRLVDLRNVDVLHAPFNILGRGVGCASVVTVHDVMWLLRPGLAEGWSALTPVRALFYRNGIRRALRRATRLVTVSHASADSICTVAPKAGPRIRVIHHGIEPSFAAPSSREHAQARAARVLGRTKPYFLVIGQHAPSKNHSAIVRAFAQAGIAPQVDLVLLQRLHGRNRLTVGAVPLEALARRLGIHDSVITLAATTQHQLVELLQGALALIQFSRFEGFGLPVLEALACGTPVIASDIAPLVEVLAGAGLHIPLQLSALAAALVRVAREPALRAELSSRGLERARAFSWDRSVASHLDVYREAAGSAG